MKFTVNVILVLMFLGSVAMHGDAATNPQNISIHAKRFSFQPSEITIYKGETVKLELTSDDVPHSLLVQQLNINSTITKGHTTEVSVTPQQAGDFHGKCGRFCGTGHGSMTFVVHVVER